MKASSRSIVLANIFIGLICSVTRADTASYELIWNSTWSRETHPDAFPSNAHFSSVIGTTHNPNFTLWEPGGLSTPGVQRVAETGSTSLVGPEIAAAIADGTALTQITASGLGRVPATSKGTFETNSTHSLVSFLTMIAPSPDWIVGGHSVDLRDDVGNWIAEIVIDAIPYDAGTDSGVDFRSANLATNPHEPIAALTEIDPFAGTPNLGTFTLRLTSLPGDFDSSGQLDVGDINTLCGAIGGSHPEFELTNNETIGFDDVSELVTRVMGTRIGDANLDGAVDFDDFLPLSNNFSEAGDWSAGDFNCDGRVGFHDLLALSHNFGFPENNSQAQTASVPEASSFVMAWVCALGLLSLRRLRATR